MKINYFLLVAILSLGACSGDEDLAKGPSLGSWQSLNDLPTTGRSNAIAFSVSGKGYWGMGLGMTSYFRDIWNYDPDSDSWIQKKDFPFDIPAEAVVTIENKAYVITYSGNLYEYNPASDNWTALAPFPMGSRPGITGFALGGKAYFGTGNNVSIDNYVVYQDFWEYDPSTNTWKQIADFPGVPRTDAISVAIDQRAYVGLGFSGIGAPPIHSDIWSFDPQAGNWNKVRDFPQTGSLVGMVFSNNSNAYIGLPENDDLHHGKIYEYSPTSNSWRNVKTFPSGNSLQTSSFAIDNRTYVIGGWWSEYSQQVWEFVP